MPDRISEMNAMYFIRTSPGEVAIPASVQCKLFAHR